MCCNHIKLLFDVEDGPFEYLGCQFILIWYFVGTESCKDDTERQ